MLRNLTLLVLAFLVAACDQSVSNAGTAPSALRGEWVVVYPAGDGERTEQRMTFGADGSFLGETLWYGYYGQPSSKLTGYSRTRGEYAVEGGRLQLRIVRSEEWQMHAVGPNPSVATLKNPTWHERGTVRVDGDRLFHTYVSAPADAPQEFTEVYQRAR